MSTTGQSKRLLSASEVADFLGISVVQVRRLYGPLGAFKVGRLVRFDPECLDRWLAERIAEAEAARSRSEERA